MKKEHSCESFRKVQKSSSIPRPLSWFNFSTLTKQTKRLFRSDGELSSSARRQQEEADVINWSHLAHQGKAVSNLDEESKWTVHYTAPWHQQENVFLPSSRPACVEDLHRQAKLNLKSVLRECDKLRKDGLRSSQYYSQGPTFLPASKDHSEEDGVDSKPAEYVSQEQAPGTIKRPKTPVSNDLSDIDTKTNWTKSLPLPTPEERMRQQAQAVPAEVVPIDVSGSEQGDFRGHSMYLPGQYSTLGRLENTHSTLRRSFTRDSSCQTDEIKIVPPSVRRIRAQKGHGIAAQMSQLSNSSGNMSTLSDTAGVLFAPRVIGDLRFHSLPRTGARVSLQPLERSHSVVSRSEDLANTLPRPINKIQVDHSVVHLRNNPRTNTLPRPKSQEVKSCQGDKVSSPACVVSPHASYSTIVIPNATLSTSSEVIVIQTSQGPKHADCRPGGTSSYSKVKPADDSGAAIHINLKDDHHSSSGNSSGSNSARNSQASDTNPCMTVTSPSLCDSAVSLNAGANTEMESQNSTLDRRNGSRFPAHVQENNYQECTSYSDDVRECKNMSDTEQWVYQRSRSGENSPQKTPSETSGYSTPVNSVYCSLDRSSTKTDTSSLYSVDNDGYYTSMHVDSGLKSEREQSSAWCGTKHSAVSVSEESQSSKDDQLSYSDRSLKRNISLKKSKKPPLPPTRTDSLRRNSKKSSSNRQVLNETLIATLQQSLQLDLNCKNSTSPSPSPSSDYDDLWVGRSRSQSSISASSSGMSVTAPNVYSICAVTPSQSEASSDRTEYAERWGYYADDTGRADDQLKSSEAYPACISAVHCDYSIENLNNEERPSIPQVPIKFVKPKIASPDKSNRVTSPSSGYSSQSNTPTASTPVTVLLQSLSPGSGKPKPKVPERKSSLLSSASVSSSSTSLSSATSDSQPAVKKSCTSPISTPPLTPPPPVDSVPLPPEPTTPTFPPPPPEDIMDSSFIDDIPDTDSESPLPPLPPPPPLLPILSILPHTPSPLELRSKQARNSSNSCNVMSLDTVDKAPFNQQSPSKSTMPLITTETLQMVQLRSVKRTERAEVGKNSDGTCKSSYCRQSESSTPALFLISRDKKQPSGPPTAVISPTTENNHEVNSCVLEEPATKNQDMFSDPDKRLNGGNSGRSPKTTLLGAKPKLESQAVIHGQDCHFSQNIQLPQEKCTSPDKTCPVSPSKKPPPVSKKPALSLIIPLPQPEAAADEKKQHEDANVRSTLSPVSENSVTGHSKVEKGCNETLNTNEMSPDRSTPVPVSPLARLFPDVDSIVSIVQSPLRKDEESIEQERQASASEPASPSDHNGDETTTENTSSYKEDEDEEEEEEETDENGDVFEPTTPTASEIPRSSSADENSEERTTPVRPRTTEDLFAAIHRSKRRVLGRKDSEEDRLRSQSLSPPVTPTGPAPNLGSLRHTGSIHRSTRKSNTSSDNFKALLLKKGSRSESGSRMSAAEMLKNTDPRRTRADSAPELQDSPATSPSKIKRSQEEWARSEGVMPRSLSHSSARYSRSRTPPSAASSKYSARNRTQSSPMTVICEGDSEAIDSQDEDCTLSENSSSGKLPQQIAGNRTVELVGKSSSLSLEDSNQLLEADCLSTSASKLDSLCNS
ncbi:NHS-like protein 1 isoform X2 [Protopterus annectens]|uniref:NHS-like protein 1 isoform X2 n=1 Tax=Protopterus annectens TaxID=7888 RepID=UPI001CFAE8EB|nr:NHS-like protein 1 isoform X2 [Protopterus annectens]